MLTRFYLPISRQARQLSTKKQVKLSVKMDEETYKMIDNEEIKPRKHAGKMNTKLVELPDWLIGAVNKELEDMPTTTILADGKRLANFLNGRHPPAEVTAVQAKYSEIRTELALQRNIEHETEKSIERIETEDERKSFRLLKKAFHSWSPVQYNRYAGLLYLVSRSAQEYAVIYRIFHEITTRDKDFRPKSLLDFGSGIGTVPWVTSHLWPNAVQEHMCVDISKDMNDLSESIISHANPKIDKVFYRQYIPFSNRTFDIVVSAYSLLELPNMQTRLNSIGKLWAKTQRYMVIIEQGTNAGYKMINEARDFIIHMERSRNEKDSQRSRIFSPCPHELRCPRYMTDNTPCNFEVSYKPMKFRSPAIPGTERFSYVVFKKGESYEESKNWPRLVRPTLLRSKHAICRMCTADGKLNEIIFTRTKHGKWMYRCAKSSKWGDRLPMETAIESVNEEAEEKEEDEQEKQEDEELKEAKIEEEANEEKIEKEDNKEKEDMEQKGENEK